MDIRHTGWWPLAEDHRCEKLNADGSQCQGMAQVQDVDGEACCRMHYQIELAEYREYLAQSKPSLLRRVNVLLGGTPTTEKLIKKRSEH